MKRHIEPYRHKRIILRLLTSKDLPKTMAWRNQEEVRRWFNYSKLITDSEHRAWFEKYSELDDDFVFVVSRTDNGEDQIGQVSVFKIDWENKIGEVGRLMIGELDALNQGFGSEAFEALVLFTSEKLGLKNLTLEVFETNTRAIPIYVKMGFRAYGKNKNLLLMAKEIATV
jgi:RimJ/RimL family protein N-acetyltransferase